MAGRHQVLVVEDDQATAEDLCEVLRSIGCDWLAVASRQEAVQALRQTAYCLILLDLQIKDMPDAIKGHVEHGKGLLREIRRTHDEHSGLVFWLPVLVVSGFAREVPTAVEVMKDGASDLIQKPLKSREVSDKVRRALEASGRLNHDTCARGPVPQTTKLGEHLVIEIPGDRVRRRTGVTIGRKRVELPNSCLKLLLHLMVGHGNGKPVHKSDLGANAEQGFKGISILRNELKAALGPGVSLIDNDYHGNYSLASNVSIGDCAIDKLLAIGDATVSKLARQLQNHLQSRRRV